MGEPAQGGSGLREESEQRPAQEWGAVLLRVLAALLVLGGAYIGTAFYFKDRPPAGVSVAGVDIGTLTQDEAVKHLEKSLAKEEAEPVVIEVVPVDDKGKPTEDEPTRLELDPAKAGLEHDYAATIEGVSGFSLDPRVLWAHVVRSERELPLVGTVDQDKLTEAVTKVAKDYDKDSVEGEVSLVDGKVDVVDAAPGRRLDVEQTVEAVADAWPQEHEVTGGAEAIAPRLTQAEVERFTKEEVEPALAGPVSVTATRGSGDKAKKARAEVQPREIAAILSVDRGKDDTLTLKLDEKALLKRLRQDLGQLEAGPADATVQLSGSKVKVVPSRAGAALDEKALMSKVREAVRAKGKDRSVTTALKVVEPEISTAASKAWKFSTMGSFTSVFPGGPLNADRTHNLHRAVEVLNGAVIMPGEQFSLGEALSPITTDNGYREAPIIVDGRLVMGTGGGLSQISTTIFNTSWFSGVQLDAHTPHSFYISRYPAGREATIAYPGLDNVWTNDTDTPVVIRTWITGTEIHMQYLGARQYDVETIEGPRREVTQPTTIVDDAASCVPQEPSEGFVITVARVLSKNGSQVHRDEFTTRYIPEDRVTCTHPDAGY